jgi:phage shock protein C
MNLLVTTIISYFEQRTFGVCTWLGEKLRMQSHKIRLFFIYGSFLAVGSPLLVYLAIAFILDLGKLVKKQRSKVWDL